MSNLGILRDTSYFQSMQEIERKFLVVSEEPGYYNVKLMEKYQRLFSTSLEQLLVVIKEFDDYFVSSGDKSVGRIIA